MESSDGNHELVEIKRESGCIDVNGTNPTDCDPGKSNSMDPRNAYNDWVYERICGTTIDRHKNGSVTARKSEGGYQTDKMTSMWFNSDIWFEMESIGQVTTYPHKTEVFTNTRDVITITIEGDVATVKRQRSDSVVVYELGALHVQYNVSKLIQYAKKKGLYLNVTDPREWGARYYGAGQTKQYNEVAKTEVVRGYENIYPYHRITALCLPDGAVRLMRYGDRTYKTVDQIRYADWDAFVQANQFVTEIPDEEELSEIEIVEEQEVNVPDQVALAYDDEPVGFLEIHPPIVDIPDDSSAETDDDSSSDYEPEKEREFYRSQAQSRKRRRIEKTMTIRMAIGGGDDENVDEKMVDVDFQFGNMSSAVKTGRQTYRLNFANGAYMLLGKTQMAYARSNGGAVWCAWKDLDDFYEIVLWLWDQPGFERPAFE